MQYNHFIGIDISKDTFDVFLREKSLHRQFKNDQQGFKSLVSWLQKYIGEDLAHCLVCFEHTGYYSLPLAVYLDKIDTPFAMISPLRIKRSLGISRGKNDQVDAKRIAEYAYLYRESIPRTQLPPKEIVKLQSLLSLRDRLARTRAGYIATRKESLQSIAEYEQVDLLASFDKMIAATSAEIKSLEQGIKAIIASNDELKQTFALITRIKGVGLVVASYLIVYTYNFTRFESWRKFACYAGIAPFDYRSGTSIQGRNKVSPLANHQIKKLLHISAMHAAFTDNEMKAYYNRRLDEGKSKMSTLNIIRNKVLARVFAVALRKTEYIELHKYAS